MKFPLAQSLSRELADLFSDGIYLLDIDGSERVKLCDDHAARLNTKDDWLLSCFDDNISLYRIDCDGNNRQK